MSDIGTFEVRDQVATRDAILRVIKNGLAAQGITADVGAGSHYYLLATAVANEIAVAQANAVIKCDEMMPDTARGDALKRWMALFGLSLRAAAGSIGYVTNKSSATTSIVAGTTLVDSAGLQYETTTTGSYANGALVQVQATSTGYQTNKNNGDVLTWVAAPTYADTTVTVGVVGGTDGLSGGVDEESEESGSARLQETLAYPPASGNWSHLARIAEEAHPATQKAFVYPAARGPATVDVAVAGYSTAYLDVATKSADRVVDPTTVTSIIAPYVQGQMPEHVDINVTTVDTSATDVSIGLTLPASPNASPPGPGGGWLDGTPWPAISGTAYTKADVTAVTSDTNVTINAPTAPTAGVSRIAWVDWYTWQLYTAKVVSFTGSGPYVCTLDAPLTGITTGEYVFPQAVNTAIYVKAILKAFAAMGPGEKTANVNILARGYRHPTPQFAWPYSLGATQLRAVTDAGDEVLDASWYYRSQTTPSVPGSIIDSPFLLIPRRIAFYPI